MAQRVLKVSNDGTFRLEDLIDVSITNRSPYQTLIYDGNTWSTIDWTQVNPFLRNVKVESDSFIANSNTTYLVKASRLGIIGYLPSNPAIGDYIEIVDKYSLSDTDFINCGQGFNTYNITIQASANFLIEESPTIVLNEKAQYIKFIYVGCQTWRVVKTGAGGAGGQGPDIDLSELVTSVNNSVGDVLLTTNDIPETVNRRYYTLNRFLETSSTQAISVFGDVEYDQTIFNGNVLTWDSTKSKWTPRSPLSSLRIDNLEDVAVTYHDTGNHPVSRGFPSTGSVIGSKEAYNSEIYTKEYSYFDPEIGINVQVPSVPTGLYIYRRDWVIGRQDADLVWRVQNRKYSDQRRLLADLQDVEIDLTDDHGSGVPKINIGNGQVLQWDGEIHRWKPGAVVSLNNTDDLPQGEVNLYLTPSSLIATSNSSITLGHLKGVDDSIIGFSPLNNPQSKVLGWVPANNRWEAVDTLTESATTSNIPEPLNKSSVPFSYNESSLLTRLYFTGDRVQYALGQWGELDWLKDVRYPYGRVHGQSLIWSSVDNAWIAGSPTSAVTTDDLPEGATNQYYTTERINDWVSSNIRPTVKYLDDMQYGTPTIGQSLIWSPTGGRYGNGGWVSGLPSLFPLSIKGSMIQGTGNGPNAYKRLDPGLQGQYLRVNYGANDVLEWADPDPVAQAVTQLPDLPRHELVRAQDLTDTIIFLGTNSGVTNLTDFQNPTTLGRLTVYQEAEGTPINVLTDRIFYSSIPSSVPGISNDPEAEFITLSSNLVFAFSYSNAYRPEGIVFQAKVLGNYRFKVSVSDDSITWETLKSTNNSNQDFIFELSEDMKSNLNLGLNSEILSRDVTLDDRNFYYVELPFNNQNFANSSLPLETFFYRYIRIEIAEAISVGTIQLYQVSLYGWVNNNTKIHTIRKSDRDKYLLTGVNNLEFVLPGGTNLINSLGLDEGFTSWLLSSPGHSMKIYTNQQGRVYSNIKSTNSLFTDPIIVPPNNLVNVVFVGDYVEYDSNNNKTTYKRWNVILVSGAGGFGGDGSLDPNYYLDLANHFGLIQVDNVAGLADVAVSGEYSDLTNKPTLSNVATSGNYNDLLNKPILGTAALRTVGTATGNLIEVLPDGKLPALDGSNLTNIGGTGTFNSPSTNKGDLIAHNGSVAVALPVGMNGYVLTADSAVSTGIKWAPVSSTGTNAVTLQSTAGTFSGDYYLDRSNHIGLIPVGAISGLATVGSTGTYNSLLNKPELGTSAYLNAGSLASEVLLLSEDNKLPALDGSLLYNIGSTLQLPGDLLVRAEGGVDANLSIGSSGQVLTVDLTSPLKIKWADSSLVANASTLQNTDGSFDGNYYRNRANHTGTQSASTITGLSSVAVTGSYNDLSNKPTLSAVAISGSYNDLTNKPTLGTAAQYSVGTSPFNIPQLNSTGRLPASLLEGSVSVATPLTSKGDLYARNSTIETRLPIGELGQYLTVDLTTDTGLKWTTLPDFTNATTLNNEPGSYYLERDNHTGTIPNTSITGLGTGSTKDAGTLADQVLLLTESNKLPALDGSLLTGILPDATTLNNEPGSYYLDRDNHTGTIPNTSVTGLGTSSTKDAGTLADQVLLLTESNKLPALDGSLLTGIQADFTNATTLNNQPDSYYLDRANHIGTILNTSVTGLGTSSTKDAGTLADQVLLLAEANKLPALDGSLLTGLQGQVQITTVTTNITLVTTPVRLVLLNNSTTITITLPISPQSGDRLFFVDAKGTNPNSPTGLGLNKVIVSANQTIQGYSTVDMDSENSSMGVVYDGTRWNIYYATY